MAEITHNHPQGGRSFAITAVNGFSDPELVAIFAGLTVKATSGTARVWQTSSAIADVRAGTALWELWAYGETAVAGVLHGAVQGASAVRLEAIGGSSILSIRD
jgi:hypothetical protein